MNLLKNNDFASMQKDEKQQHEDNNKVDISLLASELTKINEGFVNLMCEKNIIAMTNKDENSTNNKYYDNNNNENTNEDIGSDNCIHSFDHFQRKLSELLTKLDNCIQKLKKLKEKPKHIDSPLVTAPTG